jgi:8-oxo-dGTP pyrophosphatase MutT (NUDIX family)
MSELDRAVCHVQAVAAGDPEVDAFRQRMLRFAADHGDALLRSCVDGHFTASAMIVDDSCARVLLLHHTKLERWLQPGGHVDGQGDLASAALREATEETGIVDLEVVGPAIDLDIHTIPERGDEPEHEHLDVRFLVRAPDGAVLDANHEATDLRWFGFGEVAGLDVDPGLLRMVAAARARILDGYGQEG